MITTMLKQAADERRWRLIMGTAAVVLVLFVVVDVRRRGRTEPLPEGSAAMLERDSARLLPFGHSTGVHRTDLTAYTAAARVFATGGSAEQAYRAQSPRGWRYQYPPLLASLLQPISALSTPTQSLLFGLLSAALALALLDESRRWWRLLADPPDGPHATLPLFIAIAAALACFFPLLNTLQRGQVGLLVLWPLMAGFRLLWSGGTPLQRGLGGVLLAFPAVLKFIPIMPVGIAALMMLAAAWPPRTAIAVPRVRAGALGLLLGALLFAVVAPAVLIGPTRTIDATRIFMRSVVANPEFSRDWDFERHSNRNQSLDSAAWKLARTITGAERVAADPLDLEPGEQREPDAPPALARLTLVLRVLCTVGAVIVAMRLARDGTRGACAGFGLACLATLVVSPVSWGHHFTMVLPAVLALPAWLEARGRSPSAFATSAILAGAILLHYALIDLAGALGLLGLTSTAVLIALIVTIWRDRPALVPTP